MSYYSRHDSGPYFDWEFFCAMYCFTYRTTIYTFMFIQCNMEQWNLFLLRRPL